MMSKVQPEKIRAYTPKSQVFSYDDGKAILYALGIGFSADPLKE